MTAHQLAVLLAVTASNIAVVALWTSRPAWLARVVDWFARHGTALAALLALAPVLVWTAIFVVYRFPVTGDVVEFYRAQGRAAMAGGIPNLDFHSSYMPLFPYITGTVDRFWSDARSLPLFFAGCYGAAHLVWRQAMRIGGVGDLSATRLALISTCSGPMWFLGVGYQQDELLMLVFLLLALMLAVRRRDATAGFVLGIGCLSTKVLLAVAAIGVVAASRRSFRTLASFVGTLAAGAAFFLALGWSPVQMLRNETLSLQPASLTVLAAAVPHWYAAIRAAFWLPQALIAGALVMLAVSIRPREGLPHVESLASLVVIAWIGFLLLSPKALTSYRLLVLPLLPLVIGPGRGRAVWFAVYATALGVEYMVYEDWINQPYAVFIASMTSGADRLRLGVLLLLDAVIVGSEAAWFTMAVRRAQLVNVGWLRRVRSRLPGQASGLPIAGPPPGARA